MIGLFILPHQNSTNSKQATHPEPSVSNGTVAKKTIDKESLPLKSTSLVSASSNKSTESPSSKTNDPKDQNDANAIDIVERQEKYLSDQRTKTKESKGTSSLRDEFFEEYHELFEILNLTPKKTTELLDILIVKGTAQASIHHKWKEIPSGDEYEQAYKDIAEEYDLKAKQTLDTNEFKTYKQFEETELERIQVSSFISDPEVHLGEGQKQELIDAMHEEVKAKGLEWINIDYIASVTSFNNDGLNKRAANNYDRIFEAYINASKSVLSPSQSELFSRHIKNAQNTIVRMISE
jgi:hypothetical protein